MSSIKLDMFQYRIGEVACLDEFSRFPQHNWKWLGHFWRQGKFLQLKEKCESKIILNVRHTYRSRFQLLPFAVNYSYDQRLLKFISCAEVDQTKKLSRIWCQAIVRHIKAYKKSMKILIHDEDLLSYFKECWTKGTSWTGRQKSTNSAIL